MIFWIVTVLIALAAAGLLGLTLYRARGGAEPAAAYDLRVYRDQLRDVERDLARGVIAEADAERIRTEVSRRILAADTQMQKHKDGEAQPGRVSLIGAVILGVVLVTGSFVLYQQLGAPGYPDLSLERRISEAQAARESRPKQAQAEAQAPARPAPQVEDSYLELVSELRQTVAERPDDLQGLELLARHESNLGNFTAAHEAKARVIALKGDAVSALDYAEQAELLIAAAGGYISPEAEVALRETLSREPWNGPARYYWGLMLAQNDRPDLAFRIWDQTLRNGPADAPWIPPIRARIEEIAWRAGVEYALPDAPAPVAPASDQPGPSREDIEAAQDMTPEERQDMIRGMVDGLSERLATEGGTPQDWARLIGALGVLGEVERASAIYGEAQQVFGDTPEALAIITEAATRAGLGQ